MIDADGYRHNVGIILANKAGKLLWAKRVNQDAWQFPQGGVQEHETPQQAAFRELKEEVGLNPTDVRVLGRTKNWLSYRLPTQYVRKDNIPVCIGQKQIWFLLGLEVTDTNINLQLDIKPEFEQWCWVDYWQPVQNVVDFKKEVYQLALTELEKNLQQFWKV